MYDFDAMEAVDDLIDEINYEYTEAAYEAYDEIFEELCERVECGELTFEEAEIINEAAADKYLMESDKFSKIKKSIKKTASKAGNVAIAPPLMASGAGAVAGLALNNCTAKARYDVADKALKSARNHGMKRTSKVLAKQRKNIYKHTGDWGKSDIFPRSYRKSRNV